jgi:polyhydroxyalkanoate synthesis regulator phasin
VLQVAYISNTPAPAKKERETKRQKLHREAIASLAVRKEIDRLNAGEKFQELRRRIAELELKLKK